MVTNACKHEKRDAHVCYFTLGNGYYLLYNEMLCEFFTVVMDRT